MFVSVSLATGIQDLFDPGAGKPLVRGYEVPREKRENRHDCHDYWRILRFS